MLSDGSTITLAPNSAIKLSPFFNKSDRKILLEGEAVFHVTHNQQKPFIVSANEITTKVLGTRFTVRAFKHDKDVIVAVENNFSQSIQAYKNLMQTPGQKLKILILREGEPHILTLKVKSVLK